MKIPTYLDGLTEAKQWRATNTRPKLQEAAGLLRSAMAEYDDALPLGDELVLVLKGLDDLDGAIRLLHQLEQKFKQVGEETLCRWGSLLKQRANRTVSGGGLAAADGDFRESERYYARAFEEHHTFYPRINQFTVRFVRAGLAKKLNNNTESANLLRSVQTDAEAMLADPTIWTLRKPDDRIWSPASRGEACILLQRWQDAEAAYSEAMQAADGQEFYPDCMHKQIRLVLIPAFQWLSIPFEGRLSEPEKFFGRPSNGQPKGSPA